MSLIHLCQRSVHYVRDHPAIFILAAVLASILIGCLKSTPTEPVQPFSQQTFESSGEQFLNSTIEELQSIADWALTGPNQPQRKDQRLLVSTSASDSIFVYGQITPDGFGAVVTERHEYPKGLLLITVRKSHGANAGRIVTETKRYITFENFQNDIPQSSNITEVYTQSDTIVTRVLRNGLLETYTFRLPVVTRTVNAVTGSVKIVRRYGAGGAIVSEARDGTGALIQIGRHSALSDGSLVTRTEYPDTTWRTIRTLGQADRSILREITNGRGL